MSTTIRPVQPEPIFRNGFATAALALGIVGVGFALTALVDLITMGIGATAVLCGLVGLVRARRHRAGDATMAALGAIAGLIAIALAIVVYLS